VDVTALAAVAGNALVGAAMTDAWQSFRHRFARLLGRGDASRTQIAERRLDELRRALAAVPAGGLEHARGAQEAAWSARIADLLEESPGAEAELRILIDEIRPLLPAPAVTASGHAVAAGHDMSIAAWAGGIASGVIHGDVLMPDPTGPGQASS
jgi:hypothetical protein